MSKKSTKKLNKARNKSPSVKFEHTSENLTSYAGLVPVIKFLNNIGFEGLFHQEVNHERGDNAQYQLVEAMMLLVTSIIGGATSLTKCVALWADGVLRKVGGYVFPTPPHWGEF